MQNAILKMLLNNTHANVSIDMELLHGLMDVYVLWDKGLKKLSQKNMYNFKK